MKNKGEAGLIERIKNYISQEFLNENYEIEHKTLNVILLAIIVGGFFAGIGTFMTSTWQSGLIVLIMVAIVAFALWLSVNKGAKYAGITICLIVNSIVFPAMFFFSGGIYSGMPVWFILGLITDWIVLKGMPSVIIFAFNYIVMAGCIYIADMHPGLVDEMPVGYMTFDIIQALLLVAVIVGMILKYQYHVQNKQKKSIQRLSDQIVIALAGTIDAKDKYTNGHSERVAKYSREIAKKLGYLDKALDGVYVTGLLHDVGKIGISDAIINKKGKLTDEEYTIIKTHSKVGADILNRVSELPILAIGAHWHHERYDGQGYPDGLVGEMIPQIARIVCIADCYDAMTSNRSYRSALSQEEVKTEIINGSGTQFDPQLSEIMIEMINKDKKYEMREH